MRSSESECMLHEGWRLLKAVSKTMLRGNTANGGGYPMYRRQNDGRTVMVKNVAPDNRYVVP
ncbi:hypothetical protein, partial [Acinetobacter baumannii]|uniref:hypothetical protein n=1 Tax=Acinetobacter baumannii TaxID=470 RepID=UPI001178593B